MKSCIIRSLTFLTSLINNVISNHRVETAFLNVFVTKPAAALKNKINATISAENNRRAFRGQLNLSTVVKL